MSCLITEFQPVQGNGAGTTNQHPNEPSMTLYGGIYASEFVLRMSTVPQMKHVGNFQLFNENGISATNVFRQAAVNAANAGYATNTPVQIVQDGVVVTNVFLETFVTGSDPSATNSAPEISPVQVQTNTVMNPVMIPEYSVVRLEWTVTNVPPAQLFLSQSNGVQSIGWNGSTNLMYSVQSTTNLMSTWSTLGKIENAQTNFSFTNWSTAPQQFYRLAVP
jgi:hypothetical protein